jgi:hypothetical protein
MPLQCAGREAARHRLPSRTDIETQYRAPKDSNLHLPVKVGSNQSRLAANRWARITTRAMSLTPVDVNIIGATRGRCRSTVVTDRAEAVAMTAARIVA